MKWETVIGLEIHVQLDTKSKIFSGASTAYGSEQNTNTSLIDLGYPGVLPVLNKDAVMMGIKFGLAIDAKISRRSIFARKSTLVWGKIVLFLVASRRTQKNHPKKPVRNCQKSISQNNFPVI